MEYQNEKERYIVEYLKTQHTIDSNQINACALKRSQDVPLYNTLLSYGYVNNHDIAKAKAAYYQLDCVDVLTSPPDKTLLNASKRFDYLKHKALPYAYDRDGRLIIAVIDIHDDIILWANEEFGYGRYRFAITSPYDIHWTIQQYFYRDDDDASRETITRECPHYSAKSLFGPVHLFVFLSLVAVIIVNVIVNTHGTLVAFLIFSNILYIVFILFKILLFMVGLGKYPSHWEPEEGLPKILPIYSILIPLYKEKETLSHLVQSLKQLDYPKDKLDIKFVVEADDYETIEALKQLRCPANYEIIRVPYSEPQTKAKACNYALRFVKGKYITIFDAEDRPEPQQLKEALARIEALEHKKCVGVQAKLNYYNRNQNNLTGLFAIEYAIWFEFLLRGLLRLGVPIPLGGTSNHLRRDIVERLHAWDAYNVTEDADLGLRIAFSGYKIDLIHSTTWEEAPHTIRSWIKQRTRWIKGYIQTYIVHMRKPLKALKQFGLVGFLGFQLFVGAPSIVYIISPILWGLALTLLFTELHSPYYFFTQLTLINFVLGGFIHSLFGIIAVLRHGWIQLLPHCLLFPFYWVLHSLASFRAVWQLFTQPYYWDKTSHGHSLG